MFINAHFPGSGPPNWEEKSHSISSFPKKKKKAHGKKGMMGRFGRGKGGTSVDPFRNSS